ncbi:MAG: hypothetical protein U1F63_12830 [Chitinivorax sp.]
MASAIAEVAAININPAISFARRIAPPRAGFLPVKIKIPRTPNTKQAMPPRQSDAHDSISISLKSNIYLGADIPLFICRNFPAFSEIA